MANRKKRHNDFYRYGYKPMDNGEPSPKQPMDTRAENAVSTHHLTITYGITLHAVERFIVRVLEKDPDTFTPEETENAAKLMHSFLPNPLPSIKAKLPLFDYIAVVSNNRVITVMEKK